MLRSPHSCPGRPATTQTQRRGQGQDRVVKTISKIMGELHSRSSSRSSPDRVRISRKKSTSRSGSGWVTSSWTAALKRLCWGQGCREDDVQQLVEHGRLLRRSAERIQQDREQPGADDDDWARRDGVLGWNSDCCSQLHSERQCDARRRRFTSTGILRVGLVHSLHNFLLCLRPPRGLIIGA